MKGRYSGFWAAFVDILMTLFLLTLSAAVVIQSQSKENCLERSNVLNQILETLVSDHTTLEKLKILQDICIEHAQVFPGPLKVPSAFLPLPLTSTPCPQSQITATPTPAPWSDREGGVGSTGGTGTPNAGINCELSTDFLAGMKQCLKEKGLKEIEITGCSLRIPEQVLFEYNSYVIRPVDLDKVAKIADCIIAQTLLIMEKHGDKLDVVTIDGYADCNGDPAYNRVLAFRRADAMLRIILDRIMVWQFLSDQNRDTLIAFFCTRSFGATRQTQNSRCDCSGSVAAREDGEQDRRIEIQINWRVGQTQENWKVANSR